MQGLVVERLSDDLSGVSLKEVPPPMASDREVEIRVRAASLNYPDLLMTRGAYQFKPPLPFVSGMELAGEVLSAPEGCGLTKGDRVMGGGKTGAFAQRVALPASAVRKIPDPLTFEEAAAFSAAYHTAYVGLVELGGLEAGQTVLVHGASGGVGLAACDLARALGARVIAATHSDAKRSALGEASQAHAVISNRGRFRDEVARLTEGRLCDLVFDPIGGDVFDESTRCVAFGGKLLVVGFVSGRIPEIAANIPLIKGFSVVGVRAGEYGRRFPDRAARIAQELDRLVTNGQIRPTVYRTLPLASWREAFAEMSAGTITGKIVLTP